ncbi:MAG TPA: SRPBCC family protein [Bacteroidia bacterium]|nr:SRPBCC family protein [Bacteroidia bacterium]HRU18113.1 SRPBCC family protein [Bacteroidia bacterium]
MTRIESDECVIDKPANEVFAFLSNCNNLQQLMPEQVTNWKSTNDDCSFTIAGMASLGMEIKERNPDQNICVERKGKAPFDFVMNYEMQAVEDNKTKLKIAFDADLNPMLKMMAEKPLRNFLNTLAGNYKNLNQ